MMRDGGDFDASKPGAGYDAHRFYPPNHEKHLEKGHHHLHKNPVQAEEETQLLKKIEERHNKSK